MHAVSVSAPSGVQLCGQPGVTDVCIHWTHLSALTTSTTFTHYLVVYVEYKQEDELDDHEPECLSHVVFLPPSAPYNTQLVARAENSLLIRNLEPYTHYKFWVAAASNRSSIGNFSCPALLVRTAQTGIALEHCFPSFSCFCR